MLKTQTPSEPVFQTAFNQINKESKMNPRYAPMFAPNTLNNGVAIKNRFVVAPLTIYESDANGGLTGISFPSPNAFDASHLPTLREYAAIAHGQGAKIVAQIAHAGGREAEDSHAF